MSLRSGQSGSVRLASAIGQSAEPGKGGPAAHRVFVLAGCDVRSVQLLSPREFLPALPVPVKRSGKEYRVFELPSISGTGESSRRVDLSLDFCGGTELVSAELPLSCGRPSYDVEDEDDSARTAADVVQVVLDQHIEFVTEAFDKPRNEPLAWEGDAESIAIRRLDNLLDSWTPRSNTAEPRLSLIVRFAQQLPRIVQELCMGPRRVLARSREVQPVGRIQQIDSACLRWLARQPGRSVSEKAGPRQQVLGVMRLESFDTPENRVLRDFLLRSGRAAARYLREYGRQFADHERVIAVRKFRHLLHEMLRYSQIGSVSSLVGVASANYVLLHDPRYNQIWEAYQKLVHQEQEIDNAWNWRQRIWVEHSMMGLASAARRNVSNGPSATDLSADVYLHGNQVCGRFVAHDLFPGALFPARPSGPEGLILVDLHAAGLPESMEAPVQISSLVSDIALCRMNRRGKLISGMVVLCCMESAACNGVEARRIEELQETARAVANTKWRVLMLRCCTDPTAEDSVRTSVCGRLRIARVCPPLQNCGSLLDDCVRWGTEP